MGDRSNQRTFNTLRKSNREKREKRRAFRQKLLGAIKTVFLLFLVSALIYGVSAAIDPSEGKKSDATTNAVEGSDPMDPVTYVDVTMDASRISAGPLVIVNASHSFPFQTAGTMPGTLVTVDPVTANQKTVFKSSKALKLQEDAYVALVAMVQDYYAATGDASLIATSAYRSYEEQNNLNSKTKGGFSDHNSGYCIALQKETANSTYAELDAGNWLYQNCAKYGFIQRYPASKSAITSVSDYPECFRYVGVEHALFIKAQGLCLEEYVELLRSYQGDNRLTLSSTTANTYEAYYVPKTGSVTAVPVPDNTVYTVSGDNIGGFIVTYQLPKAIQ